MAKQTSKEEKTNALLKFLSKPVVLHTLYDMLFLDRRNHRAADVAPARGHMNVAASQPEFYSYEGFLEEAING